MPGTIEKSCTDKVPLIGADGYKPLWNTRANLAARTGLDLARIEHLLGRYGSAIHELLALIEAEPELAAAAVDRAEVPEGGGQVRGHARGCAAPGRHPGPPDQDLHRHLGPRRRRRPGGGRTGGAGARLGRRRGRPARSTHYRSRVAAERESQQMPDDQTADAARLGAADVRVGAG